MKAKVLITAVVILSLAIAVLINILMTIEPEIIHEIETVPTYIIEHETVVVEKPVYVEVIVYEPLELRPFESWQELAVWQGQNYIKDVEENGCVDAALELQMKALKDGYLMSTEITGVIPNLHMICSTVIDDQIIFVDPQGTMSWLGGEKGG